MRRLARMCARAVTRLMRLATALLPPREALAFLLQLDNTLYKQISKGSARYNGGVHTKHRHTRYHDFFVERIAASERVLDIGCGNGALTRDIAERSGASVDGVEIDPSKVEAARRDRPHPRVRYFVGDARTYPYDGRYDVVVMSNVLEHLEDRAAFLRQLRGAVRSGRFLIRVPLFERDWRVPLKRELGVEWRLDPTHAVEYAEGEFDRELSEAGLKLRERKVLWGEIWAEATGDVL